MVALVQILDALPYCVRKQSLFKLIIHQKVRICQQYLGISQKN